MALLAADSAAHAGRVERVSCIIVVSVFRQCGQCGTALLDTMTSTSPRSAATCVMGDPLFGQRYRAIDARDARFDGQFITAVSSTGIYCRPSCPARTPKPENVSFYLTSAAAHAAGYRA